MRKFIFFLLACMVAAGIYTNLNPVEPTPEEIAQQKAEEARQAAKDAEFTRVATTIGACKEFVKRRLKAPATAVFPSLTSDDVTQKAGVYTIVSYVDSENSFGANLRQNFECKHNSKTGKVALRFL